MVNNSYNRIARYYDFLKRIVFGNAIIDAQISLLKFIQPNSKILIAGGGTGEILEKITDLYPSELHITYVEISDKMLDISRKRNTENNTVEFILEPIEDFVPKMMYDVVITPFLFDNFKENKIKEIISQLDVYLSASGYWLYIDFNAEKANQPLWQKALLKYMYTFFRMLGHIDAEQLVDAKIFLEEKYTRISEAKFYAGFIRSYVFRKCE